MPIDWFTVGAQIINFLILVWLLKRFLYHPILDALDAREQKIKDILDDANASNAQAKKLQTALEHEQQQIDQHRLLALNKVNEEAEIQRKKLFAAAQTAADDMLRKRLQGVQRELLNLQHDLLRQSIKEVYATTRKILHDLAGLDIEQCMLNALLKRLDTLKTEEHGELTTALECANYSVLVRSAFELDATQQKEIQLCMQNKFGNRVDKTVQLTFKHVPEFINGVELAMGGWKIAWNSNNYMAALEQNINQLSMQKPNIKQNHKQLSSADV
ncbi:MAG: F-type H+-transporting ATPase subunit b [Paraglaciecola sp.]|jgi:F-type H+-transporting ATPase subunit b